MELKYYSPDWLSLEEYEQFVAQYHGAATSHHLLRTKWYMDHFDFHILLAIVDGKVVGQSCAYKTTAIIHNVPVDFWWGVDSFVLKQYRGLGIGKKLQAQLHKDWPNFSSIWYSRINGGIKRKLGAQPILASRLTYYPINSFFSILFGALFKRKKLSLPVIIKNKYRRLHASSHNRFTEKNITAAQLLSLASDIKESLSTAADFYIDRSNEDLSAKYNSNQSLSGFDIILLYDQHLEKNVGLYILTKPFSRQTFSIELNVCAILDYFIFDDSVKYKDIIGSALLRASSYDNVDGVLSFGKPVGLLNITYPKDGLQLLSTTPIGGSHVIANPYISFIDQDMEQMLP